VLLVYCFRAPPEDVGGPTIFKITRCSRPIGDESRDREIHPERNDRRPHIGYLADVTLDVWVVEFRFNV